MHITEANQVYRWHNASTVSQLAQNLVLFRKVRSLLATTYIVRAQNQQAIYLKTILGFHASYPDSGATRAAGGDVFTACFYPRPPYSQRR